MQNARDLETFNILRAEPLVGGGRTTLGKNFPLGEGWYSMTLRFNIALTVGTGAGAISEGELLFIKNILLRTGQGEILCNLPARALYRIAGFKSGTPPTKNAIAAATATYRVEVPIFFVDNALIRPEDTILDTGRYNSLSLEVTLGTVSDLLTTPGTAAVVTTLDAEILRTKGGLPVQALPQYHINYEVASPTDASTSTFVDLERSPDLAVKRLYVFECASGTAGVAFSGTPADDVKDLESVVDQTGFIVQERIHEMIQGKNKIDYGLETIPAGWTVFDFVSDGSIYTSIITGDKSRLQFKWTNKTVAANDIVSIAVEGVRALK